MKRITIIALLALGLAGCQNDSYVVSKNAAKAAENFEVNRRIVFINTWTDSVLLEAVGLCNYEQSKRVEVICRVGPGQYKRHLMSLSGHVTAVVEQLEPQPVNAYHYRVTIKPQSILPDYDMRADFGAAIDAVTPD